MIDDPYRILGVSPNATQDEIKKAYRKKAKEYHPDLHPNDPNANRRMNEVNEAYDMLTNPEKYAAQRRQQQQQQQARNPYTGNTAGQQQGRGSYQGSGGWSSDFGGFGFDDFFGFGFSGTGGQADTRPQNQAGDSRDIQQVIYYINNGSYQAAINILINIPSSGRNARWYYLSALANRGAGNSIRAMDHIQKAVQLDPNNRVYQQLLQNYRRSEQRYDERSRSHNMNNSMVPTLCLGLCAAQFCCNPFRCIRFY